MHIPPDLERKFLVDLAVPPPDSAGAIMNLVRALIAARTEKQAKSAIITDLEKIYSVLPNKKSRQRARLLRLRILSIYLNEKLIEKKIYEKPLSILRFDPKSYFPGAREEIEGFVGLFATARKPKNSKKIAVSELNHLYALTMGAPLKGRNRPEPRDPIARETYLRRLATVKTLLSLRRTALRSHLGDAIAFPAEGSPYTAGYLALALDHGDYQQLRHHTEEIVDARRESQIHVHGTLAYIQQAIGLARSRDSMRVIAGLIALTGRRPVEVAITGKVSPLKGEGGDYCVVFEGQAKTKERHGTMHGVPFPIPVLCAPPIVLEAWARLRGSERGQQIAAMTPRTFNTRLGTTLGYIVGTEFRSYLRGPRQKAQPKDLRGIYAEICNQIYNGDGLVGRRIMDNGLYYGRILGHGAHSGQVSDAYKAFVLDDLPAEPDPRPLPTIDKRQRKPTSLHGLSKLGLPARKKKAR